MTEVLPIPKDEVDQWLDEALREYERRVAVRALQRKHPYVKDIIAVLLPHGERGLRRQMVLHSLERQRKVAGLPMPDKFEQSVQSSYNHHSVDSDVFVRRGSPPEDGLFFSPLGKNSGQWAVNREKAAAWLRARLLEADVEQ